MDDDVEVVAGAVDVLAEVAGGVRLGDGGLDPEALAAIREVIEDLWAIKPAYQ